MFIPKKKPMLPMKRFLKLGLPWSEEKVLRHPVGTPASSCGALLKGLAPFEPLSEPDIAISTMVGDT